MNTHNITCTFSQQKLFYYKITKSKRNIIYYTPSTITSYYEGTWIDILDRRGSRRPPLFSIEIWNCFRRL